MEWISVNDKKPLNHEGYKGSYEALDVLVTDGTEVYVSTYAIGHGCGKPWGAWSNDNPITHWMPFPDPPK